MRQSTSIVVGIAVGILSIAGFATGSSRTTGGERNILAAPKEVEEIKKKGNPDLFLTTQLIFFHLEHSIGNNDTVERAYQFFEGWHEKLLVQKDQIIVDHNINDSSVDNDMNYTSNSGDNNNESGYYWEPHSSSINFCERDYQFSNYIVEFHNTWSSLLGLSYFGYFGLRYGNPTNEIMFQVYYSILIVLGIGSAFLHATMDSIFQASDELPILYVVLAGWYVCAEATTSKLGHYKYPWLPYFLIALGICNTSIYYTFQHCYFVFLAISHITGESLGLFGLCLCIKYRYIPTVRFLGVMVMPVVFVIGLSSWILDMVLCEDVSLPMIADALPGVLHGSTPHILWHFCGGYVAHTCIICMVFIRLENLKMKYSIKSYMGGLLPVPVLLDDNNGKH